MVKYNNVTIYFGGKAKKLGWLLPLLKTEHRWFIEPFCGSAAVSLNMVGKQQWVYCSDANYDIVNLLRCARNEPEEVMRYAMLYPASPGGLVDARAEVVDRGKPAAQRAAAMLCSLYLSYGARLDTSAKESNFSRSSINAPGGRGKTSSALTLESAICRLQVVSKLLRKIEFFHHSYEKAFERYDREGSLFYCDPPYLGSTRKDGGYMQDAPGEKWHEEFLRRCLALKGKCAISGYPSGLYARMLKDWRVERLETYSHPGSGIGKDKLRRTEVLWMNYPAPQKEIW